MSAGDRAVNRATSGRVILMVAASCALFPSAFARADTDGVTAGAPAAKRDRGAIFLGLKAGAFLPQVFSPLQGTPFAGVEVGYQLPFLRRSFSLFADLAAAEPTASAAGADPRLEANAGAGGGSGAWGLDLSQREIILGLTAMYRLPYLLGGRLGPFVGVGPRLWLLETRIEGGAGAGTPLPPVVERSRQLGFGLPFGLDYRAGYGHVFLEGQLLWAPATEGTTGPSNVGAFTVAAGYRILLGP